ncbi:MAG: class I SAM-dependent methyltransferase [Polyangiaceae bacterium]
MGRKRRGISVQQSERWVFNRMATAYAARPAYPLELVDAIAALAVGPRVADLGAGVGHLALPLAARGLDVVAVEPAREMLAGLQRAALERGLPLRALHAAAEQLPFDAARFDLVVIADALHFLDSELVGRELERVLVPRGRLAVVTCEFADTPFMNSVAELVDSAAQRRPRPLQQALRQLGALARVEFRHETRFHDETLVDPETLEQILKSVSFIGPAMNSQRFSAFRQRLHAVSEPPVWARRLTLHVGRRSARPAGKAG